MATNHHKSLHYTFLQVLIAAGAAVNSRNSWGAASLHLAAQAKASTAVDVLLASGAQPNSADKHSMAPMHYAAQASSLPIMRQLLAAGADIDSRTDLGATPLQLAANCNNLDAVALLLPAGAALDVLKNSWHDFSASMQSLVRQHVRQMCLTVACSIKGVQVRTGEGHSTGQALCADMVQCIMHKVLGADEQFVCLLLNGDSEGCM